MSNYDVIIIGAGPAGLSAANILKKKHKILIIDEYYHYGGRLLGQLYEEKNNAWWNGQQKSKELYSKIENHKNITLLLSTSVYDVMELEDNFKVYSTNGEFQSKYLIVATGAKENSIPIPGWTLPGVMTVGAAQVLTNFQRVSPGSNGVLIGINPLSMVIGMELNYAHVNVKKICLADNDFFENQSPITAFNTLINLGNSAPSFFISNACKVLQKSPIDFKHFLKFFPKKGVKMMDLPISIKEKVIRINGNKQVESVTTVKTDNFGTTIDGTEKTIDCDFVCISNGLSPLHEITSLFNMKHVYLESLGGYVPLHSKTMETEVKNLYIAGNITGIENAKIAILQGEIAAYRILNNISLLNFKLDRLEKERKNSTVKFHEDLDYGRIELQKYWEALN